MKKVGRAILDRTFLDVTVLSLCLLFSRASLASEEQEFKKLMETYDNAFFSSYSIAIEAILPISRSEKAGVHSRKVLVTGNGIDHVLVLDREFLKPGRYLPLNLRPQVSAGSDDIRHIGLPQKMTVYLGNEISRIVYEMERIALDKDSIIVSSGVLGSSPLVELHPPSPSGGASSKFFAFILPLGRGYSRLVENITSVVTNSKGIAIVEARGTYFGGVTGTWYLEVDPERDYLVRRGEFRNHGLTGDSVEAQDDLLVQGVTPVYKRGRYVRSSDYVISIEVLDYKNEANEALLQSVSATSGLAPGARVLDHNIVDTDGNVLRYEVKEDG